MSCVRERATGEAEDGFGAELSGLTSGSRDDEGEFAEVFCAAVADAPGDGAVAVGKGGATAESCRRRVSDSDTAGVRGYQPLLQPHGEESGQLHSRPLQAHVSFGIVLR